MSRIMTFVAVLGVAILFATPSSARLADNSAVFVDPVGDVPAGMPDITDVSVSNDAKGVITFVIRVPNRPTSDRDTAIYTVFDTDGRDGWDHAFIIEDPSVSTGVGFGTFDERGRFRGFGYPDANWASSSWANGFVVVRFDGRMLAVSSRSDFQEIPGRPGEYLASRFFPPDSFTFRVESDIWDEWRYLLGDLAPNTDIWSYEVKILRDLILKGFTVSQRNRTDTKVLTASMTAVRDDTGTVATGEVTCRARIGRKTLKPWPPQVLISSARPSATCSWEIPRNAKGKTVQGSLTLTDSSGLHPVVELKSFSVKVK